MKLTRKNKLYKRNKRNKTYKKSNNILKDPYKNTRLYPPINPIKNYKLKVSKLHTIAFSTYGNKDGKPVLFVHGGPGAGTSSKLARFFNPRKYYIILVDQRGCGKSKPSAETRENKTQYLIEDFEKIRELLNIDRWMVFGGSWGSTLSLAYTITHPERVTELVIRGIYTCTQEENDWITEPGGAQYISPEMWNYYEKSIPHREKYKKYLNAFTDCFSGKYGQKKRDQCLLAWSAWEDSNSSLKKTPTEEIIRELKKSKKYIEMSTLEHHYFKNKCFLEKDFFMKPENLDKLRNIPITIVQGMYDMVCPFYTAYKLHKALPHAKFFSTMAGHTALDKENIKYLVKATDYYSRNH
jgi:proline iminopeptidase